MRRVSDAVAVLGSLAVGLSACGGGGGVSGGPPAVTYNLQAGYTHLINTGLTANVTLSGTALVNGVSVPFTGTGTLTLAPAVSTIFHNSTALAQTETISGTVTAAGQQAPYSSSVVDYYAAGSYAVLGQSATNEYDVVQTPFTFPTSVIGGSSGMLGTASRYTDSTLSVSLGMTQISYFTMTPVDPGSPVAVQFTNKIYDTQNTLVETDVTTYSLTANEVISFISATAQSASGTLSVTAQ
jgi:hypothetical protein